MGVAAAGPGALLERGEDLDDRHLRARQLSGLSRVSQEFLTPVFAKYSYGILIPFFAIQ